jgi:type II secretory ATPase GspE/PulE/Tfp pilus assembly ATPase PilB-like protein
VTAELAKPIPVVANGVSTMWPMPAGWRLAASSQTDNLDTAVQNSAQLSINGEEPCRLDRRTGVALTGYLVEISLARKSLVFRASAEEAPRMVRFADFLVLHLTRTLNLEREPASTQDEFVPQSISEPQAFYLRSGQQLLLSGETLENLGTEGGTYLFPRQFDGKIGRMFLPRVSLTGLFTLEFSAVADLAGVLAIAELPSSGAQTASNDASKVNKPLAANTSTKPTLSLEPDSAVPGASNATPNLSLVSASPTANGALATAALRQKDRPATKGEAVTPIELHPTRVTNVKELVASLEKLNSSEIRPLGHAIVDLGLLTREQIDAALVKQRAAPGKPLGEVLVDLKLLTTDEIKGVMAKRLGIPQVDLRKYEVDDEIRDKVPIALCFKYRFIPILVFKGNLVVAMDNPMASEAFEAIRFACGYKVTPVLAQWVDIKPALAKNQKQAYWQLEDGNSRNNENGNVESFADGSLEFDSGDLHSITNQLSEEFAPALDAPDGLPVHESDNALVKLVNKIILDAREKGASDIHLDPVSAGRKLRIRMRIDGGLVDYTEIPARFVNAVVSRLKIMSNLDISERRKPQDGKIDFSKFAPIKLELRVATVPTNGGMESVILRLLSSSQARKLEAIGLSEDALNTLLRMLKRPHGLMLVCGPTGSGKTTTLHAVIRQINTPDRKIWTAEDPVEITQEGLSQVQVQPRSGYTFADAMRAFLRADPDVIMIGEMRDKETASIAVEASLTGHLVFSTLHTNSAPETVTRLLELGLDAFNFGDSLVGVVGQRLARKICTECGTWRESSTQELRQLAEEYCEGTPIATANIIANWRLHYGHTKPTGLFKIEDTQHNDRSPHPIYLPVANGCEQCNNTGYKGRLALYELMEATQETKKLIHRRATAADLRNQAISDGMQTLKQDGIEKTLQGATTLQQVRAVCG